MEPPAGRGPSGLGSDRRVSASKSKDRIRFTAPLQPSSPAVMVGEQRRSGGNKEKHKDKHKDKHKEKKAHSAPIVTANEPASVNLHRWESSFYGSVSTGSLDSERGGKSEKEREREREKEREREREKNKSLVRNTSQSSFLKNVRGGTWFRGNKRLGWDEYFKLVGPLEFTRSAHTRELVRRYGIPAAYRGVFWKILSHSDEFRDGDVSYSIIVNNFSQTDEDVLEQIEKDLNRTFPDDVHFHGENADGIFALRRILSSYACFDPELGYCQSMNFIVALLLLFMSEEDAFWTLVTIIQKILPDDYYQSMFGVCVDIHTFCSLLSLRLPKVWNHMESLGVDRSVVQGIVLPWFLCLYVNVLPLETTLRFFDAFFFEGDKVLFRVALALFKLSEKAILACTSMVDCIQVVCTLNQRADPELIMETVFDSGLLGRLNRSKIASLRAHHEKELAHIHPALRPQRHRSPNSRPAGRRNAAALRPEPVSPRNSPSSSFTPPSSSGDASKPSPPHYRAPSPPHSIAATTSSSSSSIDSASPLSPRFLSPSSPPRPPPRPPPLPPPLPPLPPAESPVSSSSPFGVAPEVPPRPPSLSSSLPSSSFDEPSLLPRGIPPRHRTGKHSNPSLLGQCPPAPAPPVPAIDLLPRRLSAASQEPPRGGYVYRAHPSRKPMLLQSADLYLDSPEPAGALEATPAPPIDIDIDTGPVAIESMPESALEELDPQYRQRYTRLSILVGRFSFRTDPLDLDPVTPSSRHTFAP